MDLIAIASQRDWTLTQLAPHQNSSVDLLRSSNTFCRRDSQLPSYWTQLIPRRGVRDQGLHRSNCSGSGPSHADRSHVALSVHIANHHTSCNWDPGIDGMTRKMPNGRVRRPRSPGLCLQSNQSQPRLNGN